MTTVLIIFVFIFVLGPIAKAYADRLSRELPPEASKQLAEVARLREEMDQLSAHVGRLQEEQSFLLRVLSESDNRKLQEGRDPE